MEPGGGTDVRLYRERNDRSVDPHDHSPRPAARGRRGACAHHGRPRGGSLRDHSRPQERRACAHLAERLADPERGRHGSRRIENRAGHLGAAAGGGDHRSRASAGHFPRASHHVVFRHDELHRTAQAAGDAGGAGACGLVRPSMLSRPAVRSSALQSITPTRRRSRSRDRSASDMRIRMHSPARWRSSGRGNRQSCR